MARRVTDRADDRADDRATPGTREPAIADPDGRTTFDRATVTAFEACGLRMGGGVDVKRRLDDLGVRGR